MKLRKFGFLVGLALVLGLAACGSDVPEYGVEYYIPYVVEAEEEVDAQVGSVALAVNVTRAAPMARLTEAALEYVLYDLDFLERHILENVAILNVIYRRTGVQVADVFEDLRTRATRLTPVRWAVAEEYRLEGNTAREIAANYLFSLLSAEPLFRTGLGHLAPVHPASFPDLRARAMIIYNEEREEGVEDIDRFLLHLLELYASEGVVWFYGDDYDLEVDAMGWMDTSNIQTEIIEENRIARISMRHFMNSYEMDSEIIIPFLEEIEHFEHLIIDFRGNMGGYYHIFLDLFVSPLISEPIESYMTFFLTAGESANYILELSMVEEELEEGFSEAIIKPAAEFAEYFGMYALLDEDLELLDIGIKAFHIIEPSEDYAINFDGKIWLLVDGRSASAAEMAAMDAMATGFATVVGHNTRGIMPSLTTFVSMPNAGFLFRTDFAYFPGNTGYSREEFGVTPDIIVESGDILAYVLELIEDFN